MFLLIAVFFVPDLSFSAFVFPFFRFSRRQPDPPRVRFSIEFEIHLFKISNVKNLSSFGLGEIYTNF